MLPPTLCSTEDPTHFFAFAMQLHGILGIYLTNKCNIECRHCCVKSGPHENTKLSIDKLLPQIRSVAESGQIKALHVSGGEPFLYINELKKIALEGLHVGIPVGINTNAFWAVSVERARLILQQLQGITHLFISTDIYHEEFLPLDRVLNSVKAGLEEGLLIQLNVCTEGGKNDKFVERLNGCFTPDILNKIKIILYPVELGGRANELPEAHWRGMTHELPKGACHLINRPVIVEDGMVLACCNTTVASACKESPLNLGNIKQEPLTNILTRAKGDSFISAMRYFGPRFLASLLSEQDKKKLSGLYIADDICSLCVDIMSKPELANAIQNLVETPEVQQLLAAADKVATLNKG